MAFAEPPVYEPAPVYHRLAATSTSLAATSTSAHPSSATRALDFTAAASAQVGSSSSPPTRFPIRPEFVTASHAPSAEPAVVRTTSPCTYRRASIGLQEVLLIEMSQRKIL
jgi:hypothetical protein